MGEDTKGVTYQDPESGYFEKRGLKKYAGVFSLWALGVGAVISGDFSGWNLGVGQAGFGGFLLAVVIITAMYVGLCFSIAEMSPALPHTGGAYSFARTALGPWGGYVTGLAENMEYVITTAVVCYFAAAYLQSIFDTPDAWQPAWWAGLYVVFVGLNILGVAESFRFVVFITIVALLILALFFVSALPHFAWENLWNIQPDPGETKYLPKGWTAVGAALPFAIWLYLAIEQLPLAAEESVDIKRDMPRGLIWGLATLVLTGVLITFLNVGIGDQRQPSGARRRRGPDRKLSRDHLRLRPQHIFSKPRRLFPALDVGDTRDPQIPARGAHRRSRGGLWHTAAALRSGRRRRLRRRDPQHGGLRRTHRLHHADVGVSGSAFKPP